jgi:hypothetical protein
MLDLYGTPYTKALHVVERYRLITKLRERPPNAPPNKNFCLPPDTIAVDVDPKYKGKGLQLQFTVKDKGVFTTAWSAIVTYRRGINSRRSDE